MDISKQEEIRKKAKSILDNFSTALGKVKVKKHDSSSGVGGFRVESVGTKGDLGFRESMFANAPQVEGDCILAEAKQW